jgi:hypothetical protein
VSITTGKSALSAVHAAVYGVLKNDATLATLVPGGIWDHVPQDPTWPYVRIGGLLEEPDDTMGRQGRGVALVVHVWSQYRGASEGYGIIDRVIALLRYTALTPTGWTHGDTRHVRTVLDEPELVDDVQVQHVWAEFDVLVQETMA